MISGPVYKFCTDSVADFLLAGRVRVSSLAYFAHLETAHGWDQIGDAREAGAIVILDGTIPLRHGDESLLSSFISGDGTVVAENSAILLPCPPVHAFCATTGDLSALAKVFCTPLTGYTRAVQIVDPDGFATAIYETGLVNGIPVRDLFGRPTFAEVTYGNKAVRAEDNQAPLEGAFTKPDRFVSQCETRLCLPMLDPLLHDFQDIVLPKADRWVVDTRRCWNPGGSGEGPCWDSNLEDEITSLLAEWHRQGDADRAERMVFSQQMAAFPMEAFHPTLAPAELRIPLDRIRENEQRANREASKRFHDFTRRAHKVLWLARVRNGVRLDTAYGGRRPYTGRHTTGDDLELLQDGLSGSLVSSRYVANSVNYCSIDGRHQQIVVNHLNETGTEVLAP